MFSSDDDNQGIVFGVVFGIVALVIGLVIGVAMHKKSADATQTVAAQSATEPDANGASIKIENGVVKFYFASAKADLATGANEALRAITKAVGEGKKAVISGFHDETGDMAKNEELAKQRAFAVRDALKALGVGEDKIELKKPELMSGSGSNAEARRVDVSVQ